MAVYFAHHPRVGIKIGQTFDVESRFPGLYCQYPGIEILAWDDRGDCWTEKELFVRFRAIRLEGEWFKPTKQLRNLINVVEATGVIPGRWSDPKRRGLEPVSLSDVKKRFGISRSELRAANVVRGEFLGPLTTPSLYYYLRSRGFAVSPENLLKPAAS